MAKSGPTDMTFLLLALLLLITLASSHSFSLTLASVPQYTLMMPSSTSRPFTSRDEIWFLATVL